MTYLGSPRSRLALLLSSFTAILLSSLPELDLRVARFFYRDGGFHLARSWWATALHQSVAWFIVGGLATFLVLYSFNRITGRSIGGISGRTLIYLLLVLALGAGLIVNVILKDGFGRARPRNLVEFGGSQKFTAAFQPSKECASNCSFASGDGSGAFFSLAFVLALGRRRAAFAAAIGYGLVVCFSRVASGAHFLSDNVVSFIVMWITADVLHFYLLRPREGAVCATALGGLPDQPASTWEPTRGAR